LADADMVVNRLTDVTVGDLQKLFK
jgi:hypothetical protein